MGPWILFLLLTGGGCLFVGLAYLFIAARTSRSSVHFPVGVLATVGAAKALSEVVMSTSTSAPAYGAAMQWQLGISLAWGIVVAWFVSVYSGGLRRLATFVAMCFAAAVVVNMRSPHGLVFDRVTELQSVVLPWGERIAIGLGPIDSWRPVLDWSGLVMAVLSIAACTKLVRSGQKRRAALLGAGMGAVLSAGFIHGALVDWGIVNLPYLVTPAIFAFVIVLSVELGRHFVASHRLSEVVLANERRWRSLIENAPLLIVGLDPSRKVEFSNPHFQEVTGFAEDELKGRSFEFLESGGRLSGSIRTRGSQPLAPQDAKPFIEATIRTKDASERTILWSMVPIAGDDNMPGGTLLVGADMTKRIHAETARDRAYCELEILKRQLEEENIYLKRQARSKHGFPELVGESAAIAELRGKIVEVAPTSATVLIEGETGVGKELVARLIHESGPRADKPFVRINCAAIPENLVESELFGHERGAFTGADRRHEGRFQLAHGGTLFLDEVGELPPHTQPKLLRALQDGEIHRVGGTDTIHIDARVIAATNRRLSQRVAAGDFREDLYYRLAVYPVDVPPLRERADDVELLVQFIVPRLATKYGKTIQEIPASVLRALREHTWPGNVRELINVLERAVIGCGDGILRLPERLTSDRTAALHLKRLLGNGDGNGNGNGNGDKTPTLQEIEAGYIREVLLAAGGQINGPSGAASSLGLHPSTLRSRMKKLGIRR